MLHAGDVGELWVLDQLSAIAPVIAVHGNDETADAERELPYQQVIVAGGQRILLTHAHYPDRAEEMASRTDDAWLPKLARRAAMGRAAGARIVVFGHTHIPMTYQYDDILLVNPGAFGPPNLTSRQRLQSVAILTISEDGAPSVTAHRSRRPDTPFVPAVDWDAGFRVAHDAMTETILAPDLATDSSRACSACTISPQGQARRRISGSRTVLVRRARHHHHADLRAEIEHDPTIAPEAKAEILAALSRPHPDPPPPYGKQGDCRAYRVTGHTACR